MKKSLPLILFALINIASADSDPFGDSIISAEETAAEEKLYYAIETAHDQYRRDFSEILKKADKIEIYIVTFDKASDKKNFKDDEKTIRIAPYNLHTPIIQTKVLNEHERSVVLTIIAGQISKPEHGGGAECHDPVHGIRAYLGDRAVFESTFCWACDNFGFEYPASASPGKSAWLDTTPELADTFSKILPIPKTELDRFYKLHPGLKPKE